MTECSELRAPMEAAIDYIVRAQATPKTDPLNEGGWRYRATSSDADLSVSSWQIMALKLGRRAAGRVPRALLEKALQEPWSFSIAGRNMGAGDGGRRGPKDVFFVPEDVFEKARRYLWNMYDEPGFGYDRPSSTPSMTAVGTFCTYLLGCGDDPRVRGALDSLSGESLDWDRAFGGKTSWYGWYFATQALFQGGRSYWPAWNDQLLKELLPRQETDGRWPMPHAGIDHVAGDNGVYSTAMGAMIFESYYRYPRLSELDVAER
jgi:hypothetical protein